MRIVFEPDNTTPRVMPWSALGAIIEVDLTSKTAWVEYTRRAGSAGASSDVPNPHVVDLNNDQHVRGLYRNLCGDGIQEARAKQTLREIKGVIAGEDCPRCGEEYAWLCGEIGNRRCSWCAYDEHAAALIDHLIDGRPQVRKTGLVVTRAVEIQYDHDTGRHTLVEPPQSFFWSFLEDAYVVGPAPGGSMPYTHHILLRERYQGDRHFLVRLEPHQTAR